MNLNSHKPPIKEPIGVRSHRHLVLLQLVVFESIGCKWPHYSHDLCFPHFLFSHMCIGHMCFLVGGMPVHGVIVQTVSKWYRKGSNHCKQIPGQQKRLQRMVTLYFCVLAKRQPKVFMSCVHFLQFHELIFFLIVDVSFIFFTHQSFVRHLDGRYFLPSIAHFFLQDPNFNVVKFSHLFRPIFCWWYCFCTLFKKSYTKV